MLQTCESEFAATHEVHVVVIWDTGGAILAVVGQTRVKFLGALFACIWHITDTPVAVHQVKTVAVDTRIRLALIDVDLTVGSIIARQTVTLVIAESVVTHAAMLAGVRQTFVNLLVTAETFVAIRTLTIKPDNIKIH